MRHKPVLIFILTVCHQIKRTNIYNQAFLMVHWRCKYLGGILEDWTSTSLHPHLIDWTNWATISLRIKPIFCYQSERAISNYIDFYILLFGWCFGLAQETWANCDLGRIYTFNSIPSKAKKKKKKACRVWAFLSLSLSLWCVCILLSSSNISSFIHR